MKKISITIERKDWDAGVRYTDPCGCLLARAANRTLKARSADVGPGEVTIGAGNNKRNFLYSYKNYEAKLNRAHEDPNLLPLTIVLREVKAEGENA